MLCGDEVEIFGSDPSRALAPPLRVGVEAVIRRRGVHFLVRLEKRIGDASRRQHRRGEGDEQGECQHTNHLQLALAAGGVFLQLRLL